MPNLPHSEKAGYETSDVNTRVVFMFLSAVALLIFLGIMISLIVLRSLEHRPATNQTEASPLVGDPADAVRPGPNVQADPLSDRTRILDKAEARLHSYGLVSDEPGMERAHIPIERAMELVASGEAPYRQPVTEALEAEQEETAPENNPPANSAPPETSGAAGGE